MGEVVSTLDGARSFLAKRKLKRTQVPRKSRWYGQREIVLRFRRELVVDVDVTLIRTVIGDVFDIVRIVSASKQRKIAEIPTRWY